MKPKKKAVPHLKDAIEITLQHPKTEQRDRALMIGWAVDPTNQRTVGMRLRFSDNFEAALTYRDIRILQEKLEDKEHDCAQGISA